MPTRHAAARNIMSNADPAVIVKLAHHEAQLEGLGQRMAGVETTLSAINGKLDQAISSMTRAEARPQWDLQKLLQSATYGSALVGAFVASIVYITNASFSSEIQKMGVQVQLVGDRSIQFHTDLKERIEMKGADLDKRLYNMRERIMNLEKYLMQMKPDSPKPGGMEPQMYFPPDDGPPPATPRYRDERKL